MHQHAAIGNCRMIQVGGLSVHLTEEPGHHPVVFVHGSQSWAYTWRHQIGLFSSAGYRVIAPDLPGGGYSTLDVPDASVAGLSQFLGHLLDELEIERASFVASSAGGLPVLDFAIRQPQRVNALILASTCGVPHQLPWLWRLASKPILGEATGLFLSRRLIRSSLRDAAYDDGQITGEVVEQYFQPLHRKGAWNSQLTLERNTRPDWVEENIGHVEAPTLVIWGEDDPWHPVQMAHQFGERLRNVQVHTIPQCGHLPHEECPDTFNGLALQFLEEHVE